MIKQDTIRLLRECDAGVSMGVAAIDDVLAYVTDQSLLSMLNASKKEHERLRHEITAALDRFGEASKDASIFALGMSKMKTKAELTMNPTDATIASLMTDGCNMGVKSLNKYLNEFEAADEAAKDIAKKLIHLEEQLVSNMRGFL